MQCNGISRKCSSTVKRYDSEKREKYHIKFRTHNTNICAYLLLKSIIKTRLSFNGDECNQKVVVVVGVKLPSPSELLQKENHKQLRRTNIKVDMNVIHNLGSLMSCNLGLLVPHLSYNNNGKKVQYHEELNKR